MAFDFPSSPTVGQHYPVFPGTGQTQYTWDGEKWTVAPALAPDLIAPILTALTGGETGTTTASYVVTTDENNGTIWWVVVPTAAVPPNAAQIVAGTDGSGNPATDKDSQPVFGVGPQPAMTPNGLATNTFYDFYVVHRDAALNSSNIPNDEFHTLSLDTTGPTIVSLSPVDNATGVSITTNLVITWNEPVFLPTPLGTSMHIHRASDGVTVQTWFASDFGTTWSIAGAVSTLTISAPLVPGTEYYVIIGAFSVQDAAGNGSAAYTSPTAWSFTTLAIAAPSLELYPGHDTGTVGDNTTTVVNPDLNVNFNGVTTVTGGKLYIRVNGVVESMGGLGYHALTAPEAGGGNITLTGMTALVAPGTYNIEGKYEGSGWGTILALTIAASGGADASAEVAAWKAEVIVVSGSGGGSVSSTQEARVKLLMEDLMNAGAWTMFDRIWIPSAENFKQAQTCLKTRGFFLQSGTGLTFTPAVGTGNPSGSGYGVTDFNPTAAGLNYTQNSAHHSVWILSTTDTTPGPIIAYASAPGSSLYPKFNDGNTYSRVNDNPEAAGFPNAGTQKGYWFSYRSSSTGRGCDHDGVSIGTFPSIPSIAPLNTNFVLWGDGSGFDTCTIGILTFGGGGMDATMRAAVRTAFLNYLTSIGAPV